MFAYDCSASEYLDIINSTAARAERQGIPEVGAELIRMFTELDIDSDDIEDVLNGVKDIDELTEEAEK